MERSGKELLVKEFKEIFSSALTGVLIDYKGLTVEEITNLRKTLRQKETKLRVIKNTLAKIAVKGTPFEELSAHFTETRALAYNHEDVTAPAKTIMEERKNLGALKLISGVLVSQGKGEVLDENAIKALGNLPSKEELLAKLLFVLNAPITNFVKTLNEVPAGLVRVLQAAADSKDS